MTRAAGSAPRVALVIGSGALKCAAAFGAMKVLLQEAIPIHMVVACSGGAFCGLWVAEGSRDADAAVARFARGWTGSFDRLAYRRLAGMLAPKWLSFDPRGGIFDDAALNESIRGFTGERRFEDLDIPMHLVATDFASGEKVVLSSGPLFDAVRATVSIPLVLPTWTVDGRALVDGAVCDPLPIDIALREGADVIIAMGFEETPLGSIGSGLGLLMQLKTLLVNHLYRSQYAFYNLSHHAELVPIILRSDLPVGLKDVHLIPRLVALGEEAARHEVPYLRRLIETPLQVNA